MERFFMTIPEAVHLVVQAASMGEGGDVFVLRMGEPVRILDLAEDIIRLSGLEPHKDIEIAFTGIRQGEKLSETLWDEGLTLSPTDHPDVLRVEQDEPLSGGAVGGTGGGWGGPRGPPAGVGGREQGEPLSGEALEATIEELVRLAREGDAEAIVGLLSERIPGNMLSQLPPPDMTSVL